MDLIKKFMKIGGFKTPDELEAYGEDRFFNDFPEARQYAMGGTPEAFPQIATFDQAFSYGVPPGPQYLSHGGSAYPQAQTEQQFFIPIYTDVYNPYNKAMGGSNVEMYPNANVPRVGPTNIFFQEGGQEGPPQNAQELDRLGTLNKTGAFVNNLKQTAAKANSKNAMMSAIENVGMAKYGKQLSKYAPGGPKYTVSGQNQPYISQQMSPTSSQFAVEATPPTYNEQLQSNINAALQQQYAQQYAQMMQNYAPQGDMRNFVDLLYNPRDQNQFMFKSNRSPGYDYKFRTDIPGMGRERGVSNMPFMQAYFPELYGDPDAAQKALNDPKYAERRKQLGLTKYTETPVGLLKRRMKREYYFGDATPAQSTFKDWGTGTAGQKSTQPSNPPMDLTRQNQPGPVATPSSNPIPFTLQDANAQLQQNDPRAKAIMDNLQNQLTPNPYANTSNYGPLASGFVDPTSSAGPQSPMQSDANAPMLAPGQQGYDPTVRSTTTSQPPSNTNSMDAATAQKKAGPTVNQAYVDTQMQSGFPQRTPVGPVAEQSGMDYTEPVSPYESTMARSIPPGPRVYPTGAPERIPAGPVVGPEGFGYGGYTGYKNGGSYRQGDVVYMSDDEIAEFIRNGGQIEEME